MPFTQTRGPWSCRACAAAGPHTLTLWPLHCHAASRWLDAAEEDEGPAPGPRRPPAASTSPQGAGEASMGAGAGGERPAQGLRSSDNDDFSSDDEDAGPGRRGGGGGASGAGGGSGAAVAAAL